MNNRQRWFQCLQEMGCIVCLREWDIKSDPDIHHILRNSRRIDDFHTIPLCPTHHRYGLNTKMAVSRHPWKKEFERRYGTEWELYEDTKRRVEVLFQVQPTLPRESDEGEV